MGKVERDLKYWIGFMHEAVRTFTCENEALCPVVCACNRQQVQGGCGIAFSEGQCLHLGELVLPNNPLSYRRGMHYLHRIRLSMLQSYKTHLITYIRKHMM